MESRKNKKQQGFLLMEAIVSMAIFLFVVMAVISMFAAMIQHQRRLLVEQDQVNQLTYVQDLVSRTLMQAKQATDATCLSSAGRIYELTHCPADTSIPCAGIKFINKLDNDTCTEFFLDTTDPATPLLKQQKTGVYYPGNPVQNLLSQKLSIMHVRFILNGDKSLRYSAFGTASQPRVTFLAKVMNVDGQEKTIQTTVSLRNLNKSY